MASQSIMVPPNNAPWPGLQTSSSSSASSSSAPSSSSSTSAASAYPYHPAYYHHHPHHPPPPHAHLSHVPPPHHQPPYFSYHHPYAAGPYPPPYPPAHAPSHPHPHHPHSYNTPASTESSPASSHSHRLQASAQHGRSLSPSTRSTPSSSSPTIGGGGSTETLSTGQFAISSKSSGSMTAPNPKTDKAKHHLRTSSAITTKSSGKTHGSIKTGSSSGDSNNNPATVSGSSTTSGANSGGALAAAPPKVFRFEGSISSETYKTSKSFDLAGVNILNRKPLDTKTALDKLQRRRETHNRVERKRRDCINQLVDDLTKLLPVKHLEEATSKCHRVNVLRGAVAHITFLAEVNDTLVKSLKSIKGDDFDVSSLLQVPKTEAPSVESSEDKEDKEDKDDEVEAETESRDISMDVDADVDMEEREPSKEGDDKEESLKKEDPARKVPSSSSSSSLSPSSPRLTPSRAMDLPPVIVTDAPSPSSDRISKQKVPPISIITAPTDPFSLESHRRTSGDSAVSPSSVYSTSPMFPPSPYSATGSSPNSPYVRPSSTSPSLPPISSLANLHLQSPPVRLDPSPAGDRRRSHRDEQQRYQHYPEHLSPSSRPTPTASSSNAKSSGSSHRGGPTLPPLKIPAPHHLHPSYSSERERDRHSQFSTSPKRPHGRSESSAEGSEQQPPVSPFMLSPMLSRSPSMGPLSASSAGNSPYPHWGHEETSPGLPPAHHGHYGAPPPPHAAHGYPHGYPPYAYAYHPSYGYPPHHPHAPPPPPPHHHHSHYPHSGHADMSTAPSPRHSASNAPPQPSRSLQPEPIFIQEEPWVVQRKRSSSNVSAKNPPVVSNTGNKTKRSEDESTEDVREGSTPLSPSSSVTSNISSSLPASPNHRKRSSHKVSYDEGEEGVSSSVELNDAKRIKQQQQQQERLGDDLGEQRHQIKRGVQRDSGIVVVVVEAESETNTTAKGEDQEMQQA